MQLPGSFAAAPGGAPIALSPQLVQQLSSYLAMQQQTQQAQQVQQTQQAGIHGVQAMTQQQLQLYARLQAAALQQQQQAQQAQGHLAQQAALHGVSGGGAFPLGAVAHANTFNAFSYRPAAAVQPYRQMVSSNCMRGGGGGEGCLRRDGSSN